MLFSADDLLQLSRLEQGGPLGEPDLAVEQILDLSLFQPAEMALDAVSNALLVLGYLAILFAPFVITPVLAIFGIGALHDGVEGFGGEAQCGDALVTELE